MSIGVMVAQTEEEQRNALTQCIENASELELVGMAGDGVQALEMVKRLKPQVLLCDMLLPRMDGCALLEEMAFLPVRDRPLVVILSSVNRDDVVRQAYELGAADYLLRPYDPPALIHRISQLAKRTAHATKERDKQLEQCLSSMLLKLGIPAHVQGYRFLQEAIRATVVDPMLTSRLMHELYPQVARRCQSTPERVERSIRDAVSQAWHRCNPEETRRILSRSLSSGYEKPTNGELIALLAEQLRVKL